MLTLPFKKWLHFWIHKPRTGDPRSSVLFGHGVLPFTQVEVMRYEGGVLFFFRAEDGCIIQRMGNLKSLRISQNHCVIVVD